MSKALPTRKSLSVKYRDAIRKAHSVPDLDTVISDLSQHTIKRGYTSLMDPSKIFSLRGSLLRVLPDQRDRNFLFHRIRLYVSSRRRGKLRLPAHFPLEVLRLCELTKRQLANTVHWVKPNTSIEQRLPAYLFDPIARNYPGMIWNSPRSVLGHMANVVGTLRLRKSDWPGISRQRWPSTPSFSEMLAMSRRGYSPAGLVKTSFTVRNCISSKQVSDDIRLATAIVRNQIVAIRSAIGTPEKFLRWFRYRNGFLILTTRHTLPAGLVRFLLAEWIKCPFNLWLKDNCRFKNFLKKHTRTEFIKLREVASPSVSIVDTTEEPPRVGSPPVPSFIGAMTDELLEEMGEEFAELFARLPD